MEKNNNPPDNKELLGHEVEGEFANSGGSYGNKEGFTERFIVLEQFRRCSIEGSKDVITSSKNQTEIFINCVKMLEILLLPKLDKNEDVKKKNETAEDMIEEINKEFKDKELVLVKKGLYGKPMEHLRNSSERKLIQAYQLKMGALSYMIYKLNWFGPRMASDGFEL